jgi:predicted transposase YbfD/YdcC
MQYTESITRCPKGRDEAAIPQVDVQTVLEQLTDPRRKQGTRFRLASILLLALAAMLSNHLSELAIAQWGAAQSDEVKKALGFAKGVTPHQSTIHRLFRRLKADEVEAAFRRFFQHHFDTDPQERGACAVSIDGKAQRGRLPFEPEGAYPIHAVSMVEHQTGIVLTQGHVEQTDPQAKKAPAQAAPPAENKPRTKKTQRKQTEDQVKKEQEEQKMKSELAVAALLVKQIDWNGKVLTGDALYCQRCLCHALRQAGGDYLFLVKGNQPELLEDIRLLFAPPEPAKRAGEGILRLPEQQATTMEMAHGRLDIRRIRVSCELKGYSDWPGLEQVFEIRRGWRSKGVWKESVRYGVTSLPAPIALPEHLLKLKRGHWGIENGLHYVKDVSMGEDRSTIHADNGPKIMAALRNSVVSLLRRAGFSTIAARMRYNSLHPQAALALLSLSLVENA